MRLLNAKSIKLEEFFEDQAPPYAILSHTWGDGEVTFQDMQGAVSERYKTQGYDKIIHACEQATRHNLKYVWVDTCCIDKTSSAELSEAINSMFRWYSKATICFAYLIDVPHVQLESSRWFTRGWTLQELLAPPEMVFFASNWSRIATRHDLSSTISTITGISELFLQPFQDGPGPGDKHYNAVLKLLSRASIAERMSWAAKRQTTRVEDMAYCLLGIFGINMPLLYGEGKGAYIRLQEAILQRYDDQSIFAWESDISQDVQGILAESPAAFSNCGSVRPCVMDGYDSKLSLTNKGIQLNLPISKDRRPYAVLRCYFRDNLTRLLAIPVGFSQERVCFRAGGSIRTVSHRVWRRLPMIMVHFSVYFPQQQGARGDLDDPSIIIRTDPSYLTIEDSKPDPAQVFPTGILLTPSKEKESFLGFDLSKRTARFLLKTSLRDSKFICGIDILDPRNTYNIWNIGSPILLAFRLASVPFDTSLETISSNLQQIQWSDHVFLSNRVLYATFRTENVFGQGIHIVDIRVSSNPLRVSWFSARDLLTDPEGHLNWLVSSSWTCVRTMTICLYILEPLLNICGIASLQIFLLVLLSSYVRLDTATLATTILRYFNRDFVSNLFLPPVTILAMLLLRNHPHARWTSLAPASRMLTFILLTSLSLDFLLPTDNPESWPGDYLKLRLLILSASWLISCFYIPWYLVAQAP